MIDEGDAGEIASAARSCVVIIVLVIALVLLICVGVSLRALLLD